MVGEDEVFPDQEIIKAVTQVSGNNSKGSSNNEAYGITEQSVSHADATAAFDLALRYVEQCAAATSGVIMFLRCWCNITSTCRYSSLCQKNITAFF